MKAISVFTSSLTLIVLLGISCKSSPDDQAFAFLPDTLLKEILIDPDTTGVVALSDIADSIWMMPLETHPDGLLTMPQKILIDDDKFFMLESDEYEAVFCYSTDGKFLFKIDRKGRGPGEYLLMEDFTLDRANKKLILADRNSQTLLLFDYNGQYEKTIKTELYFEFLAYLDGTRLLLLTHYLPNPKLPPNKQNQVIIYDYEKNEVVDGYFHFDGDKDTFLNLKGPINGFSESAMQTYFTIPGRNTIWSIKEGELFEFIDISFGKRAFPDGYLDKYTVREQGELAGNGTYATELINFQIAGNWIVGYYSFMNRTPYIFINYRTGQFLSTKKMPKNDFDNFPVVAMPPFHTNGNTLISVIPGELIFALANHPITKFFVPKEYRSRGEEDAPIVQFIRLK